MENPVLTSTAFTPTSPKIEQTKTGVKPHVWKSEHEKILIDWADKAMCYRWLHAKSNAKMSKMNTYFTIPVIIMSTLTGTANFAQERVPLKYRSWYTMAIGCINILAGIISTVQQFLKIAELNEAHRVSSIAWDKFYRKIRVELSKPPKERQNVYDFIKLCTEEFDRLMETSPTIRESAIRQFHKTFNKKKLSLKKQKMFEELKKPEILDVLESIRYTIYKESVAEKNKMDMKHLINTLVDEVESENEKHIGKIKDEIINKFRENFKREMVREPTKQELIDNIAHSKLDINEKYIIKYMKRNKLKTIIPGGHNVGVGISEKEDEIEEHETDSTFTLDDTDPQISRFNISLPNLHIPSVSRVSGMVETPAGHVTDGFFGKTREDSEMVDNNINGGDGIEMSRIVMDQRLSGEEDIISMTSEELNQDEIENANREQWFSAEQDMMELGLNKL